ncbi:hypothetical protein SLA2020_238700 [Shorea laevis]
MKFLLCQNWRLQPNSRPLPSAENQFEEMTCLLVNVDAIAKYGKNWEGVNVRFESYISLRLMLLSMEPRGLFNNILWQLLMDWHWKPGKLVKIQHQSSNSEGLLHARVPNTSVELGMEAGRSRELF